MKIILMIIHSLYNNTIKVSHGPNTGPNNLSFIRVSQIQMTFLNRVKTYIVSKKSYVSSVRDFDVNSGGGMQGHV